MFNLLANPTVSTFKVLLTSHICTTFTVFILIQTTIIFHLRCCNNLPFGFRAFVLAQLQSILFSSKSTYFKIKTDDATWWLPLSFREESCHVTASMALLSLCLHPLLCPFLTQFYQIWVKLNKRPSQGFWNSRFFHRFGTWMLWLAWLGHLA